MRPQAVQGAVVAGLATGPRSFTGLAAVVLTAPRDAQAQPDKALGHPAAKTFISLLALQEWVMDKLPKTPSRLEVLGIGARLAGAGASGAILARRDQVREHTAAGPPDADLGDEPPAPPAPDWQAIVANAATAAGVALGVALVGTRLRGWFDDKLGEDWPGAVLEDVSSAGLAAAAVYLSAS